MSQGHSQTISTKENRVKTVVINEDTLIQFKLSDAKLILTDVLEKQKLDTIVKEFINLNIIKDSTINTQKKIILDLGKIVYNDNIIIENQNYLINNKDIEVSLLNDVIKKQKREIRKQKILKMIGFTGAIILPITVLILTS